MLDSLLFTISCLLLGSEASPLSVKTYPLEVYKEVGFADFPTFFENRLYLADRSDRVVRAYRIDKGIEAPVLLWETPGNGQGPGEIPSTSNQAINGLSIEPKSRTLWISHRQGLLIFDEDGQLKQQIRREFNQARLLHYGDTVLFTSKNVLRDQSAVTLVERDLTTVRWQVERPHEIPITQQGAYLNPRPELFECDDLFYLFDPSWGALLCVDATGQERYFTKFPLQRVPILTVSHFDSFEYGKPFALSFGPDPRSGMVRDPQHKNLFWVIVPHRSETIRLENGKTLHFELDEYTEFRIFLCFDRTTGTQIGRYLHPGLLHKNLALVRLWDGKFLLFDKSEGEAFYLLDPAHLERLAP